MSPAFAAVGAHELAAPSVENVAGRGCRYLLRLWVHELEASVTAPPGLQLS